MALVIAPLFTMGCMYIAGDYISTRYRFGPSLKWSLLLFSCGYTIVFTFWPFFVQQLPRTAAALIRQQSNQDSRIALDIDPGPLLKAQQVLAKYREQALDADATAIGNGLEKLVDKRKAGTFGSDDLKTEQDLLARYQRLVQQSNDLKRIIRQESPGPLSAQPAVAIATVPSQSAAPNPSVETTPQIHASGGHRSKHGSDVAGIGFSVASPSKPDERQLRLDAFRSLVKTGVGLASGKRNVAIMILTSRPAGNSTPEQAFYGHLRPESINLITDLDGYVLHSGWPNSL